MNLLIIKQPHVRITLDSANNIDHTLSIVIKDDYTTQVAWINKDEAIQIVDHLKEQFTL